MYTVRFPLVVTQPDEAILEKRFHLIAKIHNNVVTFGKRQLRKLNRDPEYKDAKAAYAAAVKTENEAAKEAAGKRMSDRIHFFKLTVSDFDDFVAVDQAKYAKHLSSQQCQKEAERVFRGVEAALYGNGRDIHYKKYEDFQTICGKCPTNGVKLYSPCHQNYWPKNVPTPKKDSIYWNGLILEIKVKWNDSYVEKAMRNTNVSYCEIERLMFNDGWHYYVRIYFRGDAPKKLNPGKGRMGIDPGVSTAACVGENIVVLQELAPRAKEYNKEIQRLQNQIDGSKRASNPDNYNKDGTIKRGKHNWVYTKTCQQKKRKLKVLYRKKSAYVRQSHEELANLLISNANTFYVEQMNFTALAKRAKKTERQEKESQVKDKKGNIKTVRKFKRKRRFGKSMNDRSPGEFLGIVARKCDLYGLKYVEIDTRSFKASQLDHTTGEYIPAKLSQRFKIIGGHEVQRDLYSAFLIRNSKVDRSGPNIRLCNRTFDAFCKMQDSKIQAMKSEGISMKQCFGF